MEPLVDMGLCTIRNEEQAIFGWVTMLQQLCRRVIALVDPMTTDRTEQILMEQCPGVEMEYQDRSLGDTDNAIRGKTNKTIMHVNKSQWINDHIADGEWFIDMGADERFHPRDLPQLAREFAYAQANGYDALSHGTLIEPFPGQFEHITFEKRMMLYDLAGYSNTPDELKLGYSVDWGRVWKLSHIRLQRKYADWEQVAEPHHSFNNRGYNALQSKVPIYHFHRVKYNTLLPVNHRDTQGAMTSLFKKFKNRAPIFPTLIDFNWETYELMDPLCEFSEQCERVVVKSHDSQAQCK